MMNEKKFFTYEEQIIKLEEKGLVINDKNFAIQLLKEYSYYSLISGYKQPFKDKNNQYKIKTTIEDIYAMYQFDEELRSLFLKYILKIENHIKSLISYAFCYEYGENQNYYLDNNSYNDTPKNKDKIIKLIFHLESYVNDHQSYKYMSYYQKNYDNIPLWVMMKALTMGFISRMYSLLDYNIQSQVSREFTGINEKNLGQMLDLLARIRNVSAHNERLFDYRYKKRCIDDTDIHKELNIPKCNNQYQQGKNDLFAVLITFHYLLNQKDFFQVINHLDNQINQLCNEVKILNITQIYKYMGLPNNWLEIKRIYH